jgi:glucose-fructose oxidoreductase
MANETERDEAARGLEGASEASSATEPGAAGNGGRAGRGRGRPEDKIVRWAVIGQGHFAQTSILPAFANARNARLVALFSDDEQKLDTLRSSYRVEHALRYDQYDEFLKSGAVQAVYIALPNHLHRDFTERAARAGVHVLCEKPMALDEDECRQMIASCEEHRVKLMIAYRLHFERANMSVVDQIRAGLIGEARTFVSAFSFQVQDENIRVNKTDDGGGPLYDIGVYCINAARYVFGAEPTEVVAASAARKDDSRFAETDEQVSAILRFPNDRLATFTVAFGATHSSYYTVLGTKGLLHLEPAYTHRTDMTLRSIDSEGKTKKRTFKLRDQVAAELLYFSSCILEDRAPEPSGWEGLHDIKILRAILEAARTGRRVTLDLPPRRERPTGQQAIDAGELSEPEAVVDVQPPQES